MATQPPKRQPIENPPDEEEGEPIESDPSEAAEGASLDEHPDSPPIGPDEHPDSPDAE